MAIPPSQNTNNQAAIGTDTSTTLSHIRTGRFVSNTRLLAITTCYTWTETNTVPSCGSCEPVVINLGTTCSTSIIDDGVDEGSSSSSSTTTGSSNGGGSPANTNPCTVPVTSSNADAVVLHGARALVAAPQTVDNGGFPAPTTSTTNPCPGITATTTTENVTNNLKNPCASQVLDGLINDNLTGQIANIIQNVFGNNVNVNLDFEESSTTQGNAPATSLPTLNNGVFKAVIILNSNQITGTSQEYLATLMIHEILHAYLSYNPTNANSPQSQFTQHLSIVQNYITEFRDLLQQEFNISNESANALILEGESDLIGNAFYNSLLQSLNLTVADVQTLSLLQKDGIDGTPCSK